MPTHHLLELRRPRRALAHFIQQRVKPRTRAPLCALRQRRDRPQATPLQLRTSLQILLHGILRLLRTLHGLVERRRDVVEPLGERGGGDGEGGKTEEHHVRENLNLVRCVAEAGNEGID